MITLGPYEFTQTDALRTLANLGDLWHTMMQGRSSSAADALQHNLIASLADAMGAAPNTSLDELGTLGAQTLGNSPALEPILANTWSALAAALQALRADGQLPATAAGTVAQLSSSKGGVPKVALESVDVSFRGVVGDVQKSRNHHGRPWQALCIYSDEVIHQFRADGHPIARGSAGENITTSGLDWADIRPGVRLRIGTVLADVQAYATPCKHNAQWFSDGDFNRMNCLRGAVSRVYATVIEPGRIVAGDAVILEP
ncbi:MAG: MOSC domain-containing protein [Actinomycetota bacterium]|jgi:hypothetical protein